MQNIVATVNGHPITRFDLETTVQEYALQLHDQTVEQLSAHALAELRRGALEKLMTWELIFQNAGEQGVVVAEADVSEETERLTDQFSSQAELCTKLESHQLSVQTLRNAVRRDLTVQRVTERMSAEVPEPSSVQIEAEYLKYLQEQVAVNPMTQEEATPTIRSFLKERAGICLLRQRVAQLRDKASIDQREDLTFMQQAV